VMSKKAGGQQDAPDLEAKWKRAVADYRNLEVRVAREREELAQFSNFVLISNLLPVLDDLEEAAKEDANNGIVQVLKKFRGILAEAGLEEIVAIGKKFDPAVMEATEATEGAEMVAEVTRKGYTLNGRLLRPARVRVGNS